jgi:hypothetical protein
MLDHDSKTCREIHGLLAHLCALVVQLPQDCRYDLCEVWLDVNTKGVDDGAKTVKHNLVFCRLLLEGINDSIDKANGWHGTRSGCSLAKLAIVLFNGGVVANLAMAGTASVVEMVGS